MNTESDNKVIDKFMSIDLDEFKTVSSWIPTKYNESWDLLMPVVERIESLKVDHYRFKVRITDNECRIDSFIRFTGMKDVSFFSCDVRKIQAVYSAVVQFIHWYNSLSK